MPHDDDGPFSNPSTQYKSLGGARKMLSCPSKKIFPYGEKANFPFKEIQFSLWAYLNICQECIFIFLALFAFPTPLSDICEQQYYFYNKPPSKITHALKSSISLALLRFQKKKKKLYTLEEWLTVSTSFCVCLTLRITERAAAEKH